MSRLTLIRDGFAALARSIRRRPIERDEFTYHRHSQLLAFLVLFVFTLPVEVLLVELLVPWDLLRWVLLAVALIGSLWVIGIILSVRTFPHRLLDQVLELRYGALGHALVPYERIASAERSKRAAPRGEGLSVDARDETAWLAAGGETAMTMELSTPIAVFDGWARRGPIRTLHFAVDDPQRMLGALESRLAQTARISTTS